MLRGDKIGFGGIAVSSVCKRKASIRSEFFKEPLSGEIPFVEQKVYLQVRFCEERTGFAALSRKQVKQQACLL